MQTLQYRDLGLADYRQTWDFQTSLLRAMVDNKLAHRTLPAKSYPQEHHLLLVEHPPVFTLGKSGSLDNLLLSDLELTKRGIQFFPINRGGDITFHGPGQLVGYPVLDLECFFTDVHRYVRNIEEVIIRTLGDFGLTGYRIKDYTGVWIGGEAGQQQRKVCAIGVHLSRWVTLHGWAFNVNTDLKYFDCIVPCGIADPDKTVTSMAAELGHPVDMKEVKIHLKRHFAEVFDCQFMDETSMQPAVVATV